MDSARHSIQSISCRCTSNEENEEAAGQLSNRASRVAGYYRCVDRRFRRFRFVGQRVTRGQDKDQIQAVSSVQSEGGWTTKLQQKSMIVIGASKDVQPGALATGCRP